MAKNLILAISFGFKLNSNLKYTLVGGGRQPEYGQSVDQRYWNKIMQYTKTRQGD